MNHLQHETSPYLLQHADNPVDWYPWGEEALQKAKTEDKPILLSVGYSACHWCHVMAHESFEDEQTADMMNQYFINIKVDREERPDIDSIYMRATQLMNQGQGGWPMTVFLTPDGKPFYAGTYFPRQPRYGMPSFMQVMGSVIHAYRNRREEVNQSAGRLTDMIGSDVAGNSPDADSRQGFSVQILNTAAHNLIAGADMTYGGLYRGAPKFPSPMNLDFLLRRYAHTKNDDLLKTVAFTLEKMANGGVYDQVGYGFHRYSVDKFWLVPHFEKMLYDNAQLARVYLHAYQLTGTDFFAQITRQILDYVEREMLDSSGGFYSTQDADSEGEEGKFFVWSQTEFEELFENRLPKKIMEALMQLWDVTAEGNFEGKNILHVNLTDKEITTQLDVPLDELRQYQEKARKILFEARENRIKPGRDEKMLAAWNGMMLAAYAEAARIFDNQREHYTHIARKNAEFLLKQLSQDDGRLYRTHKNGQSKLNAYLEDYANVIDGLLELYQTTFEPRWFSEAQRLADYVIQHFPSEDGAFYDTSDVHENLISRPRNLQDNATPSGNSLMALNLLRLSAYTGEAKYEKPALSIFTLLKDAMLQYPSAFGVTLSALNVLVERPVEVALIGKMAESRTLLDVVQKPFRPTVITALSEGNQGEKATPALLANRGLQNNQPTVYVCQNFVCAAPVNTVDEVKKLLSR